MECGFQRLLLLLEYFPEGKNIRAVFQEVAVEETFKVKKSTGRGSKCLIKMIASSLDRFNIGTAQCRVCLLQ